MSSRDLRLKLAESAGVPLAKVVQLFHGLEELIGRELGQKGPGSLTIPGLLKLTVARKPATKARQGTNPFTQEPMAIAAKPARNVIRARVLKRLKDKVAQP